MKRKTIFGVMALLVVGMFFSSSLVDAYRGDYSVQGPNYDEDRHELMQEAFDNLDYDAWYELMTQDDRHPRVLDVVTEENFETFVQAHEAGINGDSETANTLRAQLGLNNGQGMRDGSGFGKGMSQENRGSHLSGQYKGRGF